ncbi:hypothetical protein [Sorangium cellulosum]|uniref:hypothetical protein n=1 Tax=Sorangium cellulosum TaxID=56 RepID=UPI00133128B4|nr:hypothetical protein [Sorangium cellulosum]
MRPGHPAPLPSPAPSPRPARAALALAALLTALPACRVGAPAQAGAPSPETLRALPDRIDGNTLLGRDAKRAALAGAGPLRVLGADMASDGDRLGAFVEVPARECMLAMARVSPTIGDVDLFAFEDDGSAFSTDEAADARASLLVCPPHPRRLYVMARVMSGAGAVSVGVQSVPVEAAEAVARAVGARGKDDESGRLESWPGLEAKIRAHRGAIGARWEDIRRIALPVGSRTASRIGATLDGGRCLDVLVSPSDEVASLEVVAEDETGRIVARARERGQDRELVLCSTVSFELSIAVRSRGTQGLVAVVIGRSQPGAEAEISGATPIERVTEGRELAEVRAAHDRALAGRGYGAPRVSTGAARLGSRTTLPIELPAGCARIDVLAGRPLADVLAELWSDAHALLGRARGGARATLFTCGGGGHARLDVESMAQPGPFAVEVRKEPKAPPALVAHPLAAARLLGRLGAVGLVDASAAAGAQTVALDSARLKILPLQIPANTCAEVIAALDAEGAGVDLRLVDTSTGESSLARARHVVSDSRCAGAAPVPASIELRLAAGKGDALVLTRTSSSAPATSAP